MIHRFIKTSNGCILFLTRYYFKHLPDYRIITMDPCTSEPRLQEFGGDGNIYSCRMLPNNTTKVVVLGTRDDFLVCIEVVSLLHHIHHIYEWIRFHGNLKMGINPAAKSLGTGVVGPRTWNHRKWIRSDPKYTMENWCGRIPPSWWNLFFY